MSHIVVNGTLNGQQWVLIIESYDGQSGVWRVATGQAGGATGFTGRSIYTVTARYPATVSGVNLEGWTQGASLNVQLAAPSGQAPAGTVEVQGTVACG